MGGGGGTRLTAGSLKQDTNLFGWASFRVVCPHCNAEDRLDELLGFFFFFSLSSYLSLFLMRSHARKIFPCPIPERRQSQGQKLQSLIAVNTGILPGNSLSFLSPVPWAHPPPPPPSSIPSSNAFHCRVTITKNSSPTAEALPELEPLT